MVTPLNPPPFHNMGEYRISKAYFLFALPEPIYDAGTDPGNFSVQPEASPGGAAFHSPSQSLGSGFYWRDVSCGRFMQRVRDFDPSQTRDPTVMPGKYHMCDKRKVGMGRFWFGEATSRGAITRAPGSSVD